MRGEFDVYKCCFSLCSLVSAGVQYNLKSTRIDFSSDAALLLPINNGQLISVKAWPPEALFVLAGTFPFRSDDGLGRRQPIRGAGKQKVKWLDPRPETR